MSQVSPQVDVGGLTLNGLAAFTPVLAALSADDVTPLAMVQMENLGSIFHINGQYALQVPDLLQRCKSTRLDRLGLLVGWRKGDAASLMAQSAGGQAISLLSMCILNLYFDESDVGKLFIDLSKKLLSQTTAISSPSQLVKVATILGSKLQVLGFGNILAAQAVRIYDAYKHFGKPVPNNFLDKIAPTDMAELLHAMTRAVREESVVVRITGSRSMGHILAIVTILFPEDAFVTIENVIVFEGLRKSILVEFTDSDGIISVKIESKLQIQSALPIIPVGKSMRMNDNTIYSYCYKWNGCMADMLQIMFIEEGLICSESFRISCCDMLEPLAKTFGTVNGEPNIAGLLGKHSFIKLLGPYPLGRVDQVCQKLWRIPPGWAKPVLSLKSAFHSLVEAFAEATTTVSCNCDPKSLCSAGLSWKDPTLGEPLTSNCPLSRLWGTVGETIAYGFSCLFVNADDSAVISHPAGYSSWMPILSDISSVLGLGHVPRPPDLFRGHYYTVYVCIMTLCGLRHGIAGSSNSSTVYMAALQTLQLPNAMNGLFILLDGQIIFNGRYHKELRITVSEMRPEGEIHQRSHPIIPSAVGEHSSFMMTILESILFLELTSTIHVRGEIVHLNMFDVILASWAVAEAKPCNHSTKTPLEARHEDHVLMTSVASPLAVEGKISIVQVSRNPAAQLLSCVRATPALLQKNCCLNCAYEEAVEDKYRMIIVG
ncbi:hypothetical protein V494_06028 [Pseudogymnoascus sp. VKM F-4513 (FW-928)]|nr:hypothetical protein V494_06028 [Pseudogymnoascus sp. VKM F-4513 (FW-928)]